MRCRSPVNPFLRPDRSSSRFFNLLIAYHSLATVSTRCATGINDGTSATRLEARRTSFSTLTLPATLFGIVSGQFQPRPSRASGQCQKSILRRSGGYTDRSSPRSQCSSHLEPSGVRLLAERQPTILCGFDQRRRSRKESRMASTWHIQCHCQPGQLREYSRIRISA